MYRTMLDLIKPKLVYLDLPLFMALLSDLFPGMEQPPTPAGALRNAIEADLVESNLQVLPATASLLQTGTTYACTVLSIDHAASEACYQSRPSAGTYCTVCCKDITKVPVPH